MTQVNAMAYGTRTPARNAKATCQAGTSIRLAASRVVRPKVSELTNASTCNHDIFGLTRGKPRNLLVQPICSANLQLPRRACGDYSLGIAKTDAKNHVNRLDRGHWMRARRVQLRKRLFQRCPVIQARL